jgi:hypothetical protein
MKSFKYTKVTRQGEILYGDIPHGKRVHQVELPRVGTVTKISAGWCAENRVGTFYGMTRTEAVRKLIAAINEDN